MALRNDIELENTRRKLAGLEELIAKRRNEPDAGESRAISLETMNRRAQKLRLEIQEYERKHQTA